MTVLSASLPGRPRTLNAERRGHHMAHRKATKDERLAWGWAWRAAVPVGTALARVRVTAQPVLSGPMQDPGNCYPSVKAAIDGLVDAGVIEDDTGEHVAAITLLAPIRCRPGEDRLDVSVRSAP